MVAGPLLSVRHLRTAFSLQGRRVAVVDDVSFDLGAGERLAVVGESGSGKTMTALSILRLVPSPGSITGGQIVFDGADLLDLAPRALRAIRGGAIAMIFQEPMTSLNPVFTVGNQIAEALALHQGLRGRAARRRAVEMLALVNIPWPDRRVDSYPHELSGGMRQRAMIAMALASRPKLLIADEPTTALDVTVQAQILDLLRQLQQEFGMAILLITHDLGVVAEFTQRVLVMYAGKVVEAAPASCIFEEPLHPYTEGLLGSIPPLDRDVDRLTAIEGVVPPPYALPSGCSFHPRCAYARPACTIERPPLMRLRPEHDAACIRHTGYVVRSP